MMADKTVGLGWDFTFRDKTVGFRLDINILADKEVGFGLIYLSRQDSTILWQTRYGHYLLPGQNPTGHWVPRCHHNFQVCVRNLVTTLWIWDFVGSFSGFLRKNLVLKVLFTRVKPFFHRIHKIWKKMQNVTFGKAVKNNTLSVILGKCGCRQQNLPIKVCLK